MNVVDLGREDYKIVWDVQKKIHQKRVCNEVDDTFLLVEHNPVVTMGKSGKDQHLLLPQKLLQEKGIAYYEIERGGDVTFHGPGQLIGYPIMNVKEGLAGIRPYIERLEETIIAALADFAIAATTKDKMIGVWTEAGKICSIGVAVKRWVSFHGFALNVNTDLSYFDLIVPCGLQNVKMTSMQELKQQHIQLDRVKKSVIRNFGKVFGVTIRERCLDEII